MRPLYLIVMAVLSVSAETARTESVTPDRCAALSVQPAGGGQRAAAGQVKQLADELWDHQLQHDLMARTRHGLAITDLPDITYDAAQKDAQQLRRLLERAGAVVPAELDHEDQLTLAILKWQLAMDIEVLDHYWLQFEITPYRASSLNFIAQIFASRPVATADDRRAYLRLLDEYAAMVEQIREKTSMQAERGVYVPEAALPAILTTFNALRDGSSRNLVVTGERLKGVDAAAVEQLRVDVERRIRERITPAFDRLISLLGDSYRSKAPETVGAHQYAGGDAYYLYAVRRYTTLDTTAEEVFEYGQRRMAEIAAEMQAIRDRVGFKGSQAEFHHMLRTDVRFIAKSPAEVERRYQELIARIEPHIKDYFSVVPKASYAARRLDPASEGGMTFGYYRPPTGVDPVGVYYYNGSQLDQRSLIGAASLIYHELIPGHHFHVALQAENTSLPMFRRESIAFGAFNEGWAEYAASLVAEMGLLDDPYDRYGRLVTDAFLTARLVVDPGMNRFGWTLQQARDYLAERTMLSDVEIASETLRYSTDWPGQALGYKIGNRTIAELRSQAQQRLGTSFDVRRFHAAVVGSGGMPMTVLREHVAWYVDQEIASACARKPQ